MNRRIEEWAKSHQDIHSLEIDDVLPLTASPSICLLYPNRMGNLGAVELQSHDNRNETNLNGKN